MSSIPDFSQTPTLSSTVCTTTTTTATPITIEYPHLKKRKLALLAAATVSDYSTVPIVDQVSDVKEPPPNDIQKFLSLRKQVKKKYFEIGSRYGISLFVAFFPQSIFSWRLLINYVKHLRGVAIALRFVT